MIHASGLGKRYGAKRVLHGLDFELEQGGFLLVTGPNGSGKTTLLRLVVGLAQPTAGELEVDVPRGRLGFLAHEPLVYRELTALENLDLYGRLYRVPERRERIGMLLERFRLWDARSERTGSFSRGMLQRLALCRAFLHEPELYILCVPDRAIADVAQGVAPGPWIAHVSGATPLAALAPHVRRFSVHPLQTFTRARGPEQLARGLASQSQTQPWSPVNHFYLPPGAASHRRRGLLAELNLEDEVGLPIPLRVL